MGMMVTVSKLPETSAKTCCYVLQSSYRLVGAHQTGTDNGEVRDKGLAVLTRALPAVIK